MGQKIAFAVGWVNECVVRERDFRDENEKRRRGERGARRGEIKTRGDDEERLGG